MPGGLMMDERAAARCARFSFLGSRYRRLGCQVRAGWPLSNSARVCNFPVDLGVSAAIVPASEWHGRLAQR